MNYKEYQVDDFLMDEFFIKWVKEPDEETNHFWQKWVGNNPAKMPEINQARQLAQVIHYRDKYVLDDVMYTEMFEEIIKAEQKKGASSIVKLGIKKSGFKWAAAAIILMFSASAAFFFLQNKESQIMVDQPKKLVMIEKSNPKGRRSSLLLSDGTKVKLNAGSTLKFPQTFEGDERRVILEGEAFFEVAENKEKPFIVSVRNVEAKVLGTSFNIQNFNELQIALVTGKLEVADHAGSKILLAPNEMVTYSGEGKINKGKFKKQEIIGWRDGILVFEQDNFETVVQKLERWYGVDIEVANNTYITGLYSGVFENEPLSVVLKGVSIASHFQYELKGKTIMIKK